MTAAVSQKALQPHPTPRLSWLQWVLESLRWGRKPSAEQRLNGIEPIPGPPRKQIVTVLAWTSLHTDNP